MADMKKVYDDLIIINLYQFAITAFGEKNLRWHPIKISGESQLHRNDFLEKN